jgi:hypothetical protein
MEYRLVMGSYEIRCSIKMWNFLARWAVIMLSSGSIICGVICVIFLVTSALITIGQVSLLKHKISAGFTVEVNNFLTYLDADLKS